MNLLIVDDDELMTDSMRIWLKPFFDSIESAYDGFEALKLIEKDIFDIVLTDSRMPAMSGEQLADIIAASYPGIRIVIMSAYNLDGGSGRYPRLKKPFMARELLEMIGGSSEHNHIVE